MKRCAVEGCEHPYHAKGYCGMHWMRLKKYGDLREGEPSRAHGDFGCTEHNAWRAMLERCRNPTNPRFVHYGARGISVCERWLSYSNFLADVGRKPSSEYSIDRIDNDGNYCKENCRWATSTEQVRNRSISINVCVAGEKVPLVIAAAALGVKYKTALKRLKRGANILGDSDG